MSTRTTIPVEVIDKVFTLYYRLPDGSRTPMEEYSIYKFIVERTQALRPLGKDIFRKKAFEAAIGAVAEQLILEDDYGMCGVHRYNYSMWMNIEQMSDVEIIDLNKYLDFFGNLKYDGTRQDFFSNRRRVQLDTKTMDKVLLASFQFILEVELERLKVFLLYGIPVQDWYSVFQTKSPDAQEAVERKLAIVLS